MQEKKAEISLLDIALMLANAVDLISPVLHNHHMQVAYIAYQLGKEIGLKVETQEDLLIAGLVHDIGGLTLNERISALQFESINSYQHGIAGYLLLRNCLHFQRIAEIIKYHHTPWENGEGIMIDNDKIAFESHILHLADRIAVLINKDHEILSQVSKISTIIQIQKGKRFHPDAVDAFKNLQVKESFWLDVISPSIDDRLKKLWQRNNLLLDLTELVDITKIISQIIDFRSRFTSLHSSGVAAVAEAIAKKRNWKMEECFKIRIAGYLHDIGKLAVPNTILEKEGKLTAEEYNIIRTHTYYSYHLLNTIEALREINQYASLHHERVDGKGYPFHFNGDELKEGSKVMAVADVFTAITEDRPYRRGMPKEKAIKLLEKLSDDKHLDQCVVTTLLENFEEINHIRTMAQHKSLLEYEDFSNQINKINRQQFTNHLQTSSL